MLRKLLPYSLKLKIKLFQRNLQEQKLSFVYPESYSEEKIGNCQFVLTQLIKKGRFHENKIHNLKLVSTKMNGLIIQPNEVFSFWKLVGQPTEKNNFKKGRNLINGKVSDDFGGGICQFSSILYHLALQTNFEIVERHAHSLDIYKEEERFTPLGADSTVVYGYRDLQFKNVCTFPIQFYSEINKTKITLKVFAAEKLSLKNVQFIYKNIENGVEVSTIVDENLLSKNYYKRL